MVNFSRENDCLYSIQSDPFYYYTGITSDGLQAFVVLFYPSVLTLLFDKEGNFLDVSERPLPESIRLVVDKFGFYDAFLQGGEREIISHLNECGFKLGTIKIKRFFLSNYNIGIIDFPDIFRESILQPSTHTLEERKFAEEELDRWSKEGLFELWLNPDSNRWIKRSGMVESS